MEESGGGKQRGCARANQFILQPEKQNRDTNQFQRFEKRPTPVHKLGHYGMCVTNFKKCYEFYSKYFNFYPSEVSPQPNIDL